MHDIKNRHKNVYSSPMWRGMVFCLFFILFIFSKAQIYTSQADIIHVVGDAKIFVTQQPDIQQKQSKDEHFYASNSTVIYNPSDVHIIKGKTSSKVQKTQTKSKEFASLAKEKVEKVLSKVKTKLKTNIVFLATNSPEKFSAGNNELQKSFTIPTSSNANYKAIVCRYFDVILHGFSEIKFPIFYGTRFSLYQSLISYFSVRPPPRILLLIN